MFFKVILYLPSNSRFKLDLADVLCTWANKKADKAKIRKVCAGFMTMVKSSTNLRWCYFTKLIRQLKRWTNSRNLLRPFYSLSYNRQLVNSRLINVRLYIDMAYISIYHRITSPRPKLSERCFPPSLTKINRCSQHYKISATRKGARLEHRIIGNETPPISHEFSFSKVKRKKLLFSHLITTMFLKSSF